MIVGASLGNDVHIVGIYRFLTLAEQHGDHSIFLGPSVPVESIVSRIQEHDPTRVIVGYRLSEDAATHLFNELKHALDRQQLTGYFTLILSCTPSLRPTAEQTGIFDFIYSGGEPMDDILTSLTGKKKDIPPEEQYPTSLPERIATKKPPLAPSSYRCTHRGRHRAWSKTDC